MAYSAGNAAYGPHEDAQPLQQQQYQQPLPHQPAPFHSASPRFPPGPRPPPPAARYGPPCVLRGV
eukprot:94692-Rhodomonas_salina.2